MIFQQFSYQIVLKNANFPGKTAAKIIVFRWFLHCLARVPPTKISWKRNGFPWFSSNFPRVAPTKLYWKNANFPWKKRWQNPLCFVDFSIVLLGYSLQKFHEKACFFVGFPAIFLGYPLPNCTEKRKFSRKKGGKTIVFRWFLHCLARVPPTKISWKRNGFSTIFQQFSWGTPYQIVLEKRKLSMKKGGNAHWFSVVSSLSC